MTKTCTEIGIKTQPTIGDVIFEKAQNLARIAAERATTRDWTEHPMWGIAVDTDKWALAYQEELGELKRLLTPNSAICWIWRFKVEKKCKWLKCWWSSVTVPGECVKNGNMENSDCSLFLSEEDKLAEWDRQHLEMNVKET